MKEERPTPETDAAVLRVSLWVEQDDPIEAEIVHPAFARRLERERDEAREANATVIVFLEDLVRYANPYTDPDGSKSQEMREVKELIAKLKGEAP